MKVTTDGKHVLVRLTPFEADQLLTIMHTGLSELDDEGWVWDDRKGSRAAAQRVADGHSAIARAAREAGRLLDGIARGCAARTER